MEKLSVTGVENKLEQLDGWQYSDGFLEKKFDFLNFKEAFSVMMRIAFECEAQKHHPNWTNVYNSLLIRLRTHDAHGVTEKDFKLAQSIEEIIKSD